MTAKENERLVRLETKIDMICVTMREGFEDNKEAHEKLADRVSAFDTFRGKVVGGAIVGGIAITALTTVIGAILYG
jgi:hypothetical protein